jgi:hydrogenase maturation protein HypF
VCPDCIGELFDADDRRFRYPFINCTNCGPRFTIIDDIPYDRPLTTMASFRMCPECQVEYENPLDRRYHAQPVACPVCGPQIWLEIKNGTPLSGKRPVGDDSDALIGEDALQAARDLLRQGKIVAIKGLGGFHLACDATNLEAVSGLRRRKLRVDKPFALMMFDSGIVERHCRLNINEKSLLESRERPVVILDRRPDSPITQSVTPGQNTLGVMLPYTPLHFLVLEEKPGYPEALVMTSGNISDEPIATQNEEALKRLHSLADAFLLHDRGIRIRCDDSVVRSIQIHSPVENSDPVPEISFIRRSRGYAPNPIRLPWEAPPLLATGPELKNTFCLAKGPYAFLSHHIGDMENLETIQAFEDGVTHFERLFRVQPEAIVYDLHPDYLATRYALDRARNQSLPAFGVQHHHAHIAACMAEHKLAGEQPLIGVSFDGTGYGDDGAIWGGEFLVADYDGYQREFHLKYVPLPGGERSIKEPWRLALTYLHQAGIPWDADLPPVIYATQIKSHISQPLDVLRAQLVSGLNSPPTSSMGRLFDAVSALAGVRPVVNYEAQAAIELEALVDPTVEGIYSWAIEDDKIDASPLINAVVADLRARVSIQTIAARFHNSIVQMVCKICLQIKNAHGLVDVALSGGVWQNVYLLKRTTSLLQKHGFHVYLHRQVPANDGGLALGQAAIVSHKLNSGILE